jgi:succinate dehydrogenase hydrophobic anchor subunit
MENPNIFERLLQAITGILMIYYAIGFLDERFFGGQLRRRRERYLRLRDGPTK